MKTLVGGPERNEAQARPEGVRQRIVGVVPEQPAAEGQAGGGEGVEDRLHQRAPDPLPAPALAHAQIVDAAVAARRREAWLLVGGDLHQRRLDHRYDLAVTRGHQQKRRPVLQASASKGARELVAEGGKRRRGAVDKGGIRLVGAQFLLKQCDQRPFLVSSGGTNEQIGRDMRPGEWGERTQRADAIEAKALREKQREGPAICGGPADEVAGGPLCMPRSEERRVGKECRSRWSPY